MSAYTNTEICTFYRRGASIQILKDLTGKNKQELEQILVEGGYMKAKPELQEKIKELYAKGLSSAEIAREVGLKSNSTVLYHLDKLGLKSSGKSGPKKGEKKMEEITDYTAQPEVKQEIKQLVEEVKAVVLTKSIPVESDTIDMLTPGQYFYLAKLTLELLKTIWEG